MAQKVNLQLLKKLVETLESQISSAEALATSDDCNEYIVELSKCLGLASGVALEATALCGDIQVLVKGAPLASAKEDMLEKLLGKVPSKPRDNN